MKAGKSSCFAWVLTPAPAVWGFLGCVKAFPSVCALPGPSSSSVCSLVSKTHPQDAASAPSEGTRTLPRSGCPLASHVSTSIPTGCFQEEWAPGTGPCFLLDPSCHPGKPVPRAVTRAQDAAGSMLSRQRDEQPSSAQKVCPLAESF